MHNVVVDRTGDFEVRPYPNRFGKKMTGPDRTFGRTFTVLLDEIKRSVMIRDSILKNLKIEQNDTKQEIE